MGRNDEPEEGLTESDYVCHITTEADKDTNSDWIVVSGATSHMTLDDSMFQTYQKKLSSVVSLDNGSKLESVGHGSVQLALFFEGSKHKYKLKQMMHVPNLRYYLLAMSAICDWSCRLRFGEEK